MVVGKGRALYSQAVSSQGPQIWKCNNLKETLTQKYYMEPGKFSSEKRQLQEVICAVCSFEGLCVEKGLDLSVLPKETVGSQLGK